VIARSTKIQLLVFLLISLVGLSYTGIKYAGLGRFFVDQGYRVGADFVDSGGIFAGAEVTYRGVPSGKVDSLELVPNGVRVTMRLKPGTQVPTDVKAVVGNRSAVGEQFVDLQPQRTGSPFLAENAVIPQSMTEIPISPTQLVVNLDDFVRSIDNQSLAITLDELGRAFTGAGPSLQRLVDSGDVLTRAAIDNLPQTTALINDGKTALDTQRDVSAQFRSFNADLAKLTDTLRSSDPDFRRLYDNGTRSANALSDLIESNRTALPLLLDNLITVAQVQKVRLPALRQILVTYPNVVAGGFTVVPDDGTSHFGLVNNSNPVVCRKGYDGYDPAAPTAPKPLPPSSNTVTNPPPTTPNLNAYCAEGPTSPNKNNVRGAAQAPRPNGLPPFPQDRPPAAGGTAGSRTPDVGAGDVVALGDYDPISGRVITQDGQRLTLGSTAGAAGVFGRDSWRWLVLKPLTQ